MNRWRRLTVCLIGVLTGCRPASQKLSGWLLAGGSGSSCLQHFGSAITAENRTETKTAYRQTPHGRLLLPVALGGDGGGDPAGGAGACMYWLRAKGVPLPPPKGPADDIAPRDANSLWISVPNASRDVGGGCHGDRWGPLYGPTEESWSLSTRSQICVCV